MKQKSVYITFSSLKLCKIIDKYIIQFIIDQINKLIFLKTWIIIFDIRYKIINEKLLLIKPSYF